MSDEKKYSFTVVFHSVNEEKLNELAAHLFDGYEPDFKEHARRVGELIIYLQSYIDAVLNDAKHADFNCASEDVSEHPKNVIKSILARSELSSAVIRDFLEGRAGLVVERKANEDES